MDEDEKIDVNIERLMSLMSSPRKWPKIFHRVGEINVMDLVGVTSYPDLPPHRMILVLVFLLVVKDRATEIRFEPWEFDKAECDEGDNVVGFRMIYEVDGQDYDVVPPPRVLSRHIAREIEALAGLNLPRRRVADILRRLASKLDGQNLMPRQGRFRIRLDEIEIDVDTLACTSDLEERYFLRFTSGSAIAALTAWKEMQRLWNRVDSRLCPDLR